MNRKLPIFALAGLLLLLAGCAAGANPQAHTPAADGTLAGFWLGLWHGLILPIAFIVSLFKPTVGIYEVHNNGGWYDAGLVLGAGFFPLLRFLTPRRYAQGASGKVRSEKAPAQSQKS